MVISAEKCLVLSVYFVRLPSVIWRSVSSSARFLTHSSFPVPPLLLLLLLMVQGRGTYIIRRPLSLILSPLTKQKSQAVLVGGLLYGCLLYLHYKTTSPAPPPAPSASSSLPLPLRDRKRQQRLMWSAAAGLIRGPFTRQMDGCSVARSHLLSGGLLFTVSHVIDHLYV